MQGVGAFRIHRALGGVVLGFVVVVFGFGMLNSVTPHQWRTLLLRMAKNSTLCF